MASTSHLTASADDTRALARTIAATLAPGAVLLLQGDLGAGKTVFVKGLAGPRTRPRRGRRSTFTLVHDYAAAACRSCTSISTAWNRSDLDEVGLDPDLAASGIVVVEWPSVSPIGRPVPSTCGSPTAEATPGGIEVQRP